MEQKTQLFCVSNSIRLSKITFLLPSFSPITSLILDARTSLSCCLALLSIFLNVVEVLWSKEEYFFGNISFYLFLLQRAAQKHLFLILQQQITL